ncbi:MAG: SDR family NAD(P)-dependent oxidoreductase [Rhodocyclaceae bacterium]|jgi:3-oxoacyl-[acyl-carrier protein] reductase|nr:SDR family NAD(P)-dependent oxidoreductase [Rhodocyclaceae bacterium]MCA3051883.1 SDR family NAD(P)-dependent oxidoreductase [Rhodocyclaceae bacterium]
MKVDGSRVLITGGGSGIGQYLVERLVGDGAEVAVLELDSERCVALRNAFPGKVHAWACDVSNAGEVDTVLQQVADSGFDPDALINNAGIIHSEPLVNMLSRGDRAHSRINWQRVIAADLDSVFFVTSRVVDRMLAKRKKGVVISISSISANGNPGQSAYSAAKAGVNALTKTWAKELGPLGFRFAAIAPGFIDTPSTRSALSDSTIERLQSQIPLRKLGDLESIYLAARHILENDYLTGTIVEVDGGLVL